MLVRVRLELFGERALVERLATRTRDLRERIGMLGKLEPLPSLGRATVRQEGVSEPRLVFQFRHLLRPLPRDRWRDQKAFASIADRALEQALERQPAEPGVQLDPGGNAARQIGRASCRERG